MTVASPSPRKLEEGSAERDRRGDGKRGRTFANSSFSFLVSLSLHLSSLSVDPFFNPHIEEGLTRNKERERSTAAMSSSPLKKEGRTDREGHLYEGHDHHFLPNFFLALSLCLLSLYTYLFQLHTDARLTDEGDDRVIPIAIAVTVAIAAGNKKERTGTQRGEHFA